MATITKTIGTAGRDYSTITAWEADLDDGSIYSSGDDAVGECYNDSVFDEAVTINGGGTVGLSSVTLTVAEGEQHDGTAGTGARLIRSGGGSIISLPAGIASILSWLDVSSSFLGDSFRTAVAAVGGSSASPMRTVANCIIHNIQNSRGSAIGVGLDASGSNLTARNSICYSVETQAAGAANAIGVDIIAGGTAPSIASANNTVHGITNQNGTGGAYAYRVGTGNATSRLQNNIGTAVSGSSTGVKSCFLATTTIRTNNASSDTTASGDGSLTSIVTADQYVSSVVGSEDLHLKEGSDCIDAGVDLFGTVDDVEIDINGNDRRRASVWDIGAHEFELPKEATIAPIVARIKRLR